MWPASRINAPDYTPDHPRWLAGWLLSFVATGMVICKPPLDLVQKVPLYSGVCPVFSLSPNGLNFILYIIYLCLCGGSWYELLFPQVCRWLTDSVSHWTARLLPATGHFLHLKGKRKAKSGYSVRISALGGCGVSFKRCFAASWLDSCLWTAACFFQVWNEWMIAGNELDSICLG